MDDPRETVLAKTSIDIENVGWSTIGVFPTADDPPETPQFMYSIGFWKSYGWPELIVYGLNTSVAYGVLANFAEWAQQEKLPRYGVGLDEILGNGYQVVLREVPEPYKPLNVAAAYYERADLVDWHAAQIVWPDVSRRYPWDAGYGYLPWVQPLIDGQGDG